MTTCCWSNGAHKNMELNRKNIEWCESGDKRMAEAKGISSNKLNYYENAILIQIVSNHQLLKKNLYCCS